MSFSDEYFHAMVDWVRRLNKNRFYAWVYGSRKPDDRWWDDAMSMMLMGGEL